MNTLYWFRHDLRLDDNPAFRRSTENAVQLVCTAFVPAALSPWQNRFWWESARELQAQLQKRGSDLLILAEPPETGLPRLARELGADTLGWSQSFNARDQAQENTILAALKAACERVPILITANTSTLMELHELPFSLRQMPLVFSDFKRALPGRELCVPPISAPERLPAGPPRLLSETPQAHAPSSLSTPAGARFRGGEGEGRRRLQHYFWERLGLLEYNLTRNGLLEFDDSAKLSPWLASGALSVRRVYQEMLDFEHQFGPHESIEAFFLELLWRDYFKFYSLKYGPAIFEAGGIRGRAPVIEPDESAWQAWTQGQTPSAFVNANMRELLKTGWMSNRGRQNVASYWAKTMKQDWRRGAQWFEQHLVDHDVENNWGNWNYVAGVGSDPRNRTFNVDRQAQMYDPEGTYTRQWTGLTDP